MINVKNIEQLITDYDMSEKKKILVLYDFIFVNYLKCFLYTVIIAQLYFTSMSQTVIAKYKKFDEKRIEFFNQNF